MTQVGSVEAPRDGTTVEPAPHAPEAVAKPPPFPAQQWQGFRAEDARAGPRGPRAAGPGWRSGRTFAPRTPGPAAGS
jgi:hypothetical protein